MMDDLQYKRDIRAKLELLLQELLPEMEDQTMNKLVRKIMEICHVTK